jgi:hypothetical protein
MLMIRLSNLSEKERNSMTLKRLVMPLFLLGIMLTMGSMAFAQVTCGLATTGPGIAIGAVNGGAGGTIGGNSQPLPLAGPSTNATATGHTEPVAAGVVEVPLVTDTSATGPVDVTAAVNRVPGGGSIRIVCVNGPVAQTPGVLLLTISFGVPVTNTQTLPAVANGIRVINGTGIFVTAGPSSGTAPSPATATANAPAPTGTSNTTCVATPAAAGCANVGIAAVNNSAGTVVIALGTPVAASAAIGGQTPNTGVTFTAGSVSTFDLAGVLVSVVGKTGAINASLSASPGISVGAVAASANAAASTPAAPVINAVTAGLVDPTIVTTGALPAAVLAACTVVGGCSSGPATLATNGTVAHNNFTLRVQEAYPELFKSAAQFNGGGVFPAGFASSVQLNVVLNNVPSGFSISNCSAALTDTTGTVAKPGAPVVTSGNAVSNILNVIFTADADLTTTDVLWITCQAGPGTATTPLPSTSITAQVELAPVGTALSSTGTANTSLLTGNVPRYNALLQPATAIPVVTFPPTQTTLLIPFAVVASGINTGIAIANTSTDVFGAANGGATPLDGTIQFTMYPQAGGTPLTATTATVKSGSVYANNLSGILPSGTTSFTGYIFAIANFPDAHGSATIYDTSTGHAELSTPVLVVLGGLGGNVTVSSTRPSPEALGQ